MVDVVDVYRDVLMHCSKMQKYNVFKLLMLFGIMAVFSFGLVAESHAADSAAAREAAKKKRARALAVDSEDKPYVSGNTVNFSRLYWSLGKFELDDDEAIDYFIRINDCNLYKRYFYDEFEWNRIQEATRTYIKTNLTNFPTRFEIVRPIEFSRYNVEEAYFQLEEEFIADEVKRIDFFSHDVRADDSECADYRMYDVYPVDIMLELTRPFSFEYVPVENDLARLYLDEIERAFEDAHFKFKKLHYKRLAYMKLKVEISQFKGTKVAALSEGGSKAIVYGRINGVEIYADSALTKPLYYENMSQKRKRRLAKSRRNTEDEDEKKEKSDNPFERATESK